MMPCETEDCDGDVPIGWRLDNELSACSECGRKYRVYGDETYDPETEEVHDWWAIVAPDADSPW